MPDELAERRCRPCEGGVSPLPRAQALRLLERLEAAWRISADGKVLARRFEFPAYSRSVGFANAVAWIAIAEGHHPELRVGYAHCEVRWTTFAIGGLSENDFICAAKTDRLVESAP
ncbi:MAG: 4a-hydroxytetrahydrobiopterin dehydratase [Pseudomonadota bacterium]